MNGRKRIHQPEIVEDARRVFNLGGDIELILVFLRNQGFALADCIDAVENLLQRPFSDAKRIVVHSEAWSNRYETDTKLRETAREALRQLAASQSPDLPSITFEGEAK